jgi:hypothetical protein
MSTTRAPARGTDVSLSAIAPPHDLRCAGLAGARALDRSPVLAPRGTWHAPHFRMTTKTIRHTFHTIGDHSSDVARAIGSGTADFARRFGTGTAHVARRVGPWRALIGLAVIGGAVCGGVLLARYVRARRAERATDEALASEQTSTSHPRSHTSRRADHLGTH